MNRSIQVLLPSLLLAAGGVVVACESDVEDEQEPAAHSLHLTYSPMYSAFVEGHEAQVVVQLASRSLRDKGAKFSSSDPTVAAVSDTPYGATVTVKKGGTVAIKVALGDETGVAQLIVRQYSEAQWEVGQARYTVNEPAIVVRDGGMLNALAVRDPVTRNPAGACATCHGEEAPLLQVQDTPFQTAGYSDPELIAIITMGVKPDGTPWSAPPSYPYGEAHSWSVTQEEQQGLVAFLRTKAPQVQAVSGDGLRSCGPADAAFTLCDNRGNPIELPGRDGGTDAGAAQTPFLDAGSMTTMNDGSTQRDSGVTVARDAGAAGDAT